MEGQRDFEFREGTEWAGPWAIELHCRRLTETAIVRYMTDTDRQTLLCILRVIREANKAIARCRPAEPPPDPPKCPSGFYVDEETGECQPMED